jgi:hypothetical protein
MLLLLLGVIITPALLLLLLLLLVLLLLLLWGCTMSTAHLTPSQPESPGAQCSRFAHQVEHLVCIALVQHCGGH